MSQIIDEEFNYLLLCIINGFILSMLYDVFRITRRVVKHKKWLICTEDILYGIGIGIYLFSVNLEKNNGTVRLFMFAFLLLGSILYFKLFSNSVVCLFTRLLIKIKKKILFLLRIVGKITINKNIRWKRISKFRKL